MTVPNLVVVGSNHDYAPVAIREQLAFSGDALTHGLQTLRGMTDEGAILSTCNRTEIYVVDHDGQGRQRILDLLVNYHHVPRAVLEHASYIHEGQEAVRHLFRVASGLDSLVLGEPQILSQIRDALDHGRAAGSVGPSLQRLFTDALRAGKRARTETDIARNRVSIAHAAVDLAAIEGGELGRLTALVIGAGKMAALTAKLLKARGVKDLLIVNRSLDKAQELAMAVDGRAVPISGIEQALAWADLVIGAVMVDEPVVTPDRLRKVNHEQLLIDISVPRSIASECGALPGIHVRDVDALEPLAADTRRQYADEVAKVEALVALAVDDYAAWCHSRRGAAAIASFHDHGQSIRDREVERTLRKLSHLTERDQNLVRAMAHAISQKLMHGPTISMREAPSSNDANEVLKILGAGPDAPMRRS